MMMNRNEKTVFLETFGCQMNFLDSELVIGQLRDAGFRLVDDRDSADVILFNTCAVRDHAEQKVTSRLGELRAIKAARPGVVIGVLGCQAEREGKTLISRFPHVDLLCGPNRLHELAEMLARLAACSPPATQGSSMSGERIALSGKSRGRRPEPADAVALESLDMSRAFAPDQQPLQAFVRVQRGCDKFCAYCVVPVVRGPEVCRPPENIVAEVRRLVEAGCREVTLLGQTVNSYAAADSAGQHVTLARLLGRICQIDSLARVRFVTSYPGDFDETIFRVMAEQPKICPYLHIPAQSGSDRMLSAMRRRYTAEDYYRLMGRARELVPNISLASDFIVGFPGETEADFAATVEMVRRVRYKNCFVFKYSPRPGTAAWHLADSVPDEVKRDRNNALLAVQAEVASAANAGLVGQLVTVLVEGESKQQAAAKTSPGPSAATRGGEEATNKGSASQVNSVQLTGRTTADQIVVFDCPQGVAASSLIGRLAELRVDQVTPYTLIARLERVESLVGPAAAILRYKTLTGPRPVRE